VDSKVALRYIGPAVDAGTMDVYQASANMIAFSEFVVLISKVTFGPEVETRAEVTGFERGSFVTQLAFSVAGATATIMSSVSPHDMWTIFKESIALWKHLRGSPPTKVVEDSSQHVTVTNNSGQVIQIRTDSLTVVMSEKGAQTVEQFVRKALEPEGMDRVEIAANGRIVAEIPQSERDYFVAVAPSETVTDTTIKMALTIEAPVFKEGNKWRFSDGQNSFYADIEDAGFLSRVNDGERFGKGDVLFADVRIAQEQVGLKLSATRSLVKVHQHLPGATQLRLPD
jgi:hypothetical protein